MKCQKCQFENNLENQFCANCGSQLVAIPEVVYASFGRRLSAVVLDYAILVVLGTIVSVLLTIIGGLIIGFLTRGSRAAFDQSFDLLFALIPFIVSLPMTILYWVYPTGKTGQTLGKRILKIKVIRVDGSPRVGYLKAFLRELIGKGLSLWIFGIGFLWMLLDSKKQTWADKIAETIVVKI